MEDKISWIASLIIKQSTIGLDKTEQVELDDWINESPENRRIYEGLINNQTLATKLDQFDDAEKGKEMAWDRLQNRELPTQNVRVVYLRRWIKYVAAAAIIVSILAGYFLLVKPNPKPITKTEEKDRYKNDIPAPTGSKTRLVLADNTMISLDDAKNGKLAQQGNTVIIKENGELNYKNGKKGKDNGSEINKLITEKGGFSKITLQDSTQVWLNSNSTLTYPTAFVGSERKVSLTGEAYFEVAHNSAKPFIVNVNGKEDVKVLGTHFNIMAYEDESEIKTTLLEGSVEVTKNNISRKIKPGEQAQLNINGEINVVDSVNLDGVVAWKNGLFVFDGEDIVSMMRKLERWYDIDVKYEAGVSGKFSARKLSKDAPISKVLGYFELTEGVHFKVEGNRVTVTR